MTCCGPRNENDPNGYRPDFRTKPLTEKFYARHEVINFKDRKLSNVSFFEKEIEKRLQQDPRNFSLTPNTENQVYGWIEQLAFKYLDENDRELMLHPKKSMKR